MAFGFTRQYPHREKCDVTKDESVKGSGGQAAKAGETPETNAKAVLNVVVCAQRLFTTGNDRNATKVSGFAGLEAG